VIFLTHSVVLYLYELLWRNSNDVAFSGDRMTWDMITI